MVSQNKKLLIITGSFGNGHLQVTNSIVKQFGEMNLNHLTVIEHDLFLEAHPIMTSIAKQWYINSFKYFRNMYKFFYYSRPEQIDKCFYKYYGLNKLLNLLIKEKPDLILLTFPTPVVSVLTEQFNLNIPIATVITDYRLHKNWVTPHSNRYYVATKDLKNEIHSIGIDEKDIKVTGIPISKQFEEPIDRYRWLTKHKLDPDKKVILMSAGAFGVSTGFSTMISKIDMYAKDAQVVMICGNSKSLKNELSTHFKGNKNVLILGYTKHMNEWMATSQLMITKPGGITISEAFSRHLPLIFLNPAPGQELENADYFEQKGYGKIATTPEEATKMVISLTNQPNKLKEMTKLLEENYIKKSTETICNDLLSLLSDSLSYNEVYGKVPMYAKYFIR
ncbi:MULTISPECIES: diglucosyl diacylglycerol synthase [Mammaliicoccus]|uniref:Diglucosyl diacylglycerol synthase n=3 Tax=Mammaliicoccus TaxID=2803850 RepID=A0ABS5MK18_9STAP|nr:MULTISPECIES: diglucosyl diacylglycerol synthase [Mammaliicoccus]MBL0847496.1 diglucosyl diacylglycerol synthase [Mammaliicoccus fleurettii]MBS3671627.1 diglucosyl diacylglycerol synthase [Mammaliicoccus fleurettii]MBS3696222.1 diglucosyl diacylglycerol synthase [Mammaliicoccus fleurettii]MBW0764812.1 diglucosyl diacylglycerol synthase [Mammaliicoccus fleurettii]MEB6201921.1 diglucosyl diacylglycerol synthase [Mammaliicoccus fleurettii]